MQTEGAKGDPAPLRPTNGHAVDGMAAREHLREQALRTRARAVAVPVRRERHALPVNDFMQELRREVRRSTRSGGALSIALYRVGASGDAMLETLHRLMRETDMLGHVGDDLLAVLCPDTGEEGLRGFTRKVGAATGLDGAEVAVASFPDPLFQTLAGSHGGRLSLNFKAAGEPDPSAAPASYRLKRTLDLVGAALALIVLSPLMATIALLVRFDSRGPVIFRQTRLGRGGAPFTFYKFRSMAVDADDGRHREFASRFVAGDLPATSDGASARYKLRGDPRVTRIGNFLRRSSMDELPQFFNVLKGDMSLVGPRPPIPYEIEHYQTWHLRRILTTRPGITGLWQVEGRSRVTFNEMVRMDLRYIRQCSLWLDLRILAKTCGVVLRADGAA
jgi:lipopolysaccharide/colanic/teichoic acid biosynthesis glycosyltransferase